MDGGAWWSTVHGVAKSQTQLSDFTFFHFTFIYLLALLIRERKCLKNESCTRPLTENVHFEIVLAQGESSRAMKQLA